MNNAPFQPYRFGTKKPPSRYQDVDNIFREIECFILNKKNGGIGRNFVIQVGCFDAATGLDAFPYSSFEKALLLGKMIQHKNSQDLISHHLLVNNLVGNNIPTQYMASSTAKRLFDSHSAIAQLKAKAKASGASLTVTTRRYARNWGLRKIRKIMRMENREVVHPDLYTQTQADHVHWKLRSELGEPISLVETHPTKWTAKCPIIIGAYYALLFFAQAQEKNTTIIDFCAANDKEKVRKGVETALRLFLNQEFHQCTIIPIFCDNSCSAVLPYPSSIGLLNNELLYLS